MQFLKETDELVSQELIEKIRKASNQKQTLEREIENLRMQIDETLEDLQYSIDQECQQIACEHFHIHRDEYSLLKQIFNNQEREHEISLQEGMGSIQFFMVSEDEMVRFQISNLESKNYLTIYNDLDDKLFVRLRARFFLDFKNTLEEIETRIRNLDIYRNLFRGNLNEN